VKTRVIKVEMKKVGLNSAPDHKPKEGRRLERDSE
jgi:hypothetical protein